MKTVEQTRQELLDSYDADDLVDVLNIESEEILDRFEDKVIEYIEQEVDDEADINS